MRPKFQTAGSDEQTTLYLSLAVGFFAGLVVVGSYFI
jgi:hypothetical protein